MLEHKLQVPRVVDEGSWRQGWDRDGDRLVTKLALALVEPGEKLPPILEKPDAIAYKRESVWRVSGPCQFLSGGSQDFHSYRKGLPFRLMTLVRFAQV